MYFTIYIRLLGLYILIIYNTKALRNDHNEKPRPISDRPKLRTLVNLASFCKLVHPKSVTSFIKCIVIKTYSINLLSNVGSMGAENVIRIA